MSNWETIIHCLGEQRFRRAEELLEEWCIVFPKDFYAQSQLVSCYYRRRSHMSQWEALNRFFEAGYHHENADVVKHFMRAELLMHLGKRDEAEAAYRSVVRDGLDNATTRHALGRLLMDGGLYSEASKEFDTALKHDNLYLPAISDYSMLLFDQGRFDHVESLIEDPTSIREKPECRRFHSAEKELGLLQDLQATCVGIRNVVEHVRNSEPDEALRSLWPLFRRHRTNCSITRTSIFLLYSLGWIEVGRRRLNELFSNSHPVRFYAEGLVLWYEGNWEEAIYAYDTALGAVFDYPLVHCARSLACNCLGRVEEAEVGYSKAHERQPWLVYARLGLVEAKAACGHWDRVVQLADLDKEMTYLAETYDVSGTSDLARLEYLLLRAHLLTGNAKKALTRVRADKNPLQDASLRFCRGMVYVENSCYAEAEEEIEEALNLDHDCLNHTTKKDRSRLELLKKRDGSGFIVNLAVALFPYYDGMIGTADEEMNKLVETKYHREARLWYYKGLIVSQLKSGKSTALKDLKKAIEMDNALDEAVILLCTLLRSESNGKTELLKLAQQLPHSKHPLHIALALGEEQSDSRCGKKVTEKILAIDPLDTQALLYLIRRSDAGSEEWVSLLDCLSKRVWFEFEAREKVAEGMLSRGLAKQSQKQYRELMDDGHNSLRCCLMFGIASLAEEGT